MSGPITTSGRYVQYAELRRVALEMALDRFQSSSDSGEDILELAEKFFQFLVAGKINDVE